MKINSAFRYAKFARIAINWIAAEPDGDNIISRELQTLLGTDLLEFNRPQRVLISGDTILMEPTQPNPLLLLKTSIDTAFLGYRSLSHCRRKTLSDWQTL